MGCIRGGSCDRFLALGGGQKTLPNSLGPCPREVLWHLVIDLWCLSFHMCGTELQRVPCRMVKGFRGVEGSPALHLVSGKGSLPSPSLPCTRLPIVRAEDPAPPGQGATVSSCLDGGNSLGSPSPPLVHSSPFIVGLNEERRGFCPTGDI